MTGKERCLVERQISFFLSFLGKKLDGDKVKKRGKKVSRGKHERWLGKNQPFHLRGPFLSVRNVRERRR